MMVSLVYCYEIPTNFFIPYTNNKHSVVVLMNCMLWLNITSQCLQGINAELEVFE